MAYDQNRGFTSGGQFVGLLGGTLSQILGGYLGAKLEQDRTRRESESNQRILQARYPNMPKEQLEQYSQIPSQQLPQMMQGLGAAEFQRVMGGGMPQQQGAQEQQMEQGMAPQEGMMQQQDMGAPEGIPQQQGMMQEQGMPEMSMGEESDGQIISDAASELAMLEDRLKGSRLDEAQYMKVRKYIDDNKRAIQESILNDENLKVKIAEADRKRLLDDEKTVLAREKFERKIVTENREHKLKKLEQEEKSQDRLFKEYHDPFILKKIW